jgi:hypothetical protein
MKKRTTLIGIEIGGKVMEDPYEIVLFIMRRSL